MCIAAAGSAEFAAEVAAASGAELKLAGINWVYSPVADVNINPANSVIPRVPLETVGVLNSFHALVHLRPQIRPGWEN
jgi:hypothetical protein